MRTVKLSWGMREAPFRSRYVGATTEPSRSHVRASDPGESGGLPCRNPSIRSYDRGIINSVSGFFQCFVHRKLEGQSLTRSDLTDRAPLSRWCSTRDERIPDA